MELEELIELFSLDEGAREKIKTDVQNKKEEQEERRRQKRLKDINRYKRMKLHLPIPLIEGYDIFYLSGNMEGAIIVSANELKSISVSIPVFNPEVNPMEAYKRMENDCSLVAYPLVNGHLDVLQEELPALNKELFNKHSFIKLSTEQYKRLLSLIEKPKLSSNALEELEAMKVDFLIFNARKYYDTLYQGNLPK